jgi:hypothetical protein
MGAPTQTDDGWWLTVMWCADDEGVIDARAAAPPAGPPPGSPLAVIGPSFAGGLSGMIAEEGGRQLIRLRLPPAEDPSLPWDRPLIVQLALTWDPVRVATMRPNELAKQALEAFGRAVLAAGRPG